MAELGRTGVPRGGRTMAELGAQKWWLGFERKWWVLVAIGAGNFMSTFGGSMVNTVLPLISRTFGIPLTTVGWVSMAYLLTVAALLLTFGRLGDMVGHTRVYLAGFVVFIAGSALCGLAPNEWSLIASRAVQAVGSAMLLSGSPAILTGAFPESQRGQALGLQATMTYIGLTAGPLLGGYIADSLGWHWVFFINVPTGIVATALALIVVPSVKPTGRREAFDPAGAATMAIGLALGLLAVSKGEEWGWGSPTILLMLVASAVLLAAFVWIEKAVRFPVVDLTLFRDRLFSAATSSALINYVAAYAVTFLMPFYFMQARGYSPSFAGLMLTTTSLAMVVVAPLSGILSDRVGSRLPSTAGMALTTLSIVALALVGPDTGEADLLWRLVLLGVGIGLFTSPNSSAILGSAPPNRRGTASGIVSMARNVGGVLGMAIVGAIFSASLARWMLVLPDLAFYQAIRESFFAIAAISTLGTLISLVRGPRPLRGPLPTDRT